MVSVNRAKIFLAPAISLLCMGAIAALQLSSFTQLRSQQQQVRSREAYLQEAAREKVNLSLLKQMPTLGLDNLIANWSYLNFVQYFGDDLARRVTGYQLAPEYFEVIINRDPHFLHTYSFLSNSVAIFAGQPERAVALIEQGLQSLSPQTDPKAYYVWRYKGITELLFLGNPQAAKQSFTRAAEWASRFTDPESQSVAKVSQQTAQFLARNPDSKEAQISAWFMVLTSATDRYIQELAVKRIEALGGRLFFQNGQVQVQFSLPK